MITLFLCLAFLDTVGLLYIFIYIRYALEGAILENGNEDEHAIRFHLP